MARTPKVTADELAATVKFFDEPEIDLRWLASRAREKGIDVMPTDQQIATLAQHQAAIADFISALMSHRALDERSRDFEAELKRRV